MECAFEIFDKLGHLTAFVRALQTESVGEAHTKTLCDIVRNDLRQLSLEMAVLKDVATPIVGATFMLESDKLVILAAHDKIYELLELGAALGDPARNSGLLTETDALLASFSAITVDQQVQRPVSSTQEVQHGVITRVGVSHVTIDWSGSRSVTRSGDHMETLPRADVKFLLEKHWASRRTELVSAALSGYAYLEDRVHGRCNTIYSLVPTMHFLDLVRVFDPSWVVANLSRLEDSAVKDLCMLPPFEEADLTSRLLAQAPAYRAAVIAGCEINRSDINQFTEGVLAWWRVHGNKFSAWADAARIAFAFKPSSAQAERIFSMLKAMFTPQQASSLMDMVQGSLMMRYNGRGAV